MLLFDTHCHIDLYPDSAGLVDEIERDGVYTIAVTNTPAAFRRCAASMADRRFIRVALGLHPQLFKEQHRETASLLQLLGGVKYVGEVGLDFSTADRGERALQAKVFGSILEECATQGGKVLTVHSRRAADDVIDAVGDAYPNTLILHWFSGSHSALHKGVAAGFYFSVNTSMLAGEKGRRIVAAIPRERVLTETDGPFVKVGGRPARPRDVRDVVRGLSHLWGTSEAEVAQTLLENIRRALS